MDAQQTRRRRLNELLDTTKGKTYFVVFVTFAFTAVMILFGLLPSYSAFLKQYEQNQLRATHITALKQKLSTLEQLVVEDQAKSALKGVFNRIMPNGFNQVDYVLEIDKFAIENGLTVDSMTFSTIEALETVYPTVKLDDNARGMLINIQLEGDKESLSGFINDMEASIRLYSINDLTAVKKSDAELLEDNFERPYRYSILAQTYYFELDE